MKEKLTFGSILRSLIFTPIIYPIFSMLGGLIGFGIFGKKEPSFKQLSAGTDNIFYTIQRASRNKRGALCMYMRHGYLHAKASGKCYRRLFKRRRSAFVNLYDILSDFGSMKEDRS